MRIIGVVVCCLVFVSLSLTVSAAGKGGGEVELVDLVISEIETIVQTKGIIFKDSQSLDLAFDSFMKAVNLKGGYSFESPNSLVKILYDQGYFFRISFSAVSLKRRGNSFLLDLDINKILTQKKFKLAELIELGWVNPEALVTVNDLGQSLLRGYKEAFQKETNGDDVFMMGTTWGGGNVFLYNENIAAFRGKDFTKDYRQGVLLNEVGHIVYDSIFPEEDYPRRILRFLRKKHYLPHLGKNVFVDFFSLGELVSDTFTLLGVTDPDLFLAFLLDMTHWYSQDFSIRRYSFRTEFLQDLTMEVLSELGVGVSRFEDVKKLPPSFRDVFATKLESRVFNFVQGLMYSTKIKVLKEKNSQK